MNKTLTPLKIVTPKNKPFSPAGHYCYTLDVNGRSYSPDNLQQSLGNDPDPMSLTVGNIYENKKFKVRTTSNFVKTTRSWRNVPYQRIRKVQNAINQEKKTERQANSKRTVFVNPQFDPIFLSLPTKIVDRPSKLKQVWDFRTKLQGQKLKQIQQLIMSRREQSSQRRNVIRFQHKGNCLETNQLVLLRGAKDSSLDRQQGKLVKINKASVYADVVKNRKKLSEKRHARKKANEHSLLGRINSLQNTQQVSLILRNSFDRSRGCHDQ